MFKPSSIKYHRRYRQIISIFAKYGIKDFLSFTKTISFTRPLNNKKDLSDTATNFRLALQELGPTFIKGGQLLSSRSDLIPDYVIKEMQKLLDEVDPGDFDKIAEQIEKELGRNFEKIFDHIDQKPIASASLAQVYKAKLKNGKIIALKVQRSGIKKLIKTDVSILFDFAKILQDKHAYLKAYNLTDMVGEFEKNIIKELDFKLEGLNSEIIASNLKEYGFINIPKVHWKYTTSKILCTDFAYGSTPAQIDEKSLSDVEKEDIAWKLLETYSKQIYIDGFFQADPHSGNILIENTNKINLVDFGSIGKMDETLRKEIATLVVSFIFKEGEHATESLLRMGKQSRHCNYSSLKSDISALVADYATIPSEHFNMGKGLLEMIRIAASHNIEVPANFSLVGKTFLLLDDITRRLSPHFDYNKYLTHLAPILIYERINTDYAPHKILRNVIESGNLVSNLPSKVNFFIDKIIKDDFHVVFQHEGLEKTTNSLYTSGFAIALSLVAAGLSILSILSFMLKLPIVSIILGIITFALLMYLLVKMLIKIKF